MPTYDYECSEGHNFSKVQTINSPAVKKCPKCGATSRRMISAIGFVLKGKGWAKDGYSK